LIVEYISSSNSEGARAPSSKLIVGCGYSKISFHFCKDCRIFCEGVKDSSTIDIVGNNGIIGLADCDRISLVGLLTLADCWIVGSLGDIGLIVRINGLVGRIVQNGLNGFINLGVSFISLGLVGFIGLGLVSIAGLIGHISLVGLGGLSGISGLVGRINGVSFISLSLDSLGGLIGHISLVGRCIIGLIESAASSNHWPISLIGVIGLCLIASSASAASLARRLISFIGLIGSSTHRLFCERLATAVNEATKITWRLKQAAALGVATLRLSATETAASTYSFTISSLHMHSLVREKIWWWLALARKKMWWWIASFGESYNDDVLLYAKQLFSLRLPQMTKYCVMRECDNIHPWIFTTGDLAFSHQQEFTVLNSQKGFRRSLPEISLFSQLFSLY
jgi:hypothetical protein